MVARFERTCGGKGFGAHQVAAAERLLNIAQIDFPGDFLFGFFKRCAGLLAFGACIQHSGYPCLRIHQHADGTAARPAREISLQRAALVQQQGGRCIFPGIDA